jgi:hypothetical protein
MENSSLSNFLQPHLLPLSEICLSPSALCFQTPSTCEIFEVFSAVKIQVEVFWVVKLCSDVVGYQCFGVSCCLLLQGEDEGRIDL